MSVARLAAVAVLALAVLGCSSGEADDGRQPPELDAAQLRRLGLTREVPGQVREACAEARRLAKVRVVCPRLVPDVPLTRIEGLWGSMVSGPGLVYELSFVNAGGFFDRPLKGVEHWITGGGVAEVVQKEVLTDFVNEVKGNPKLMRSLAVRGRLVRVYRFPRYPAGGPNGDHVAAVVRVGDELVFASLHGERYVNAAVAMAVDLAERAEHP